MQVVRAQVAVADVSLELPSGAEPDRGKPAVGVGAEVVVPDLAAVEVVEEVVEMAEDGVAVDAEERFREPRPFSKPLDLGFPPLVG